MDSVKQDCDSEINKVGEDSDRSFDCDSLLFLITTRTRQRQEAEQILSRMFNIWTFEFWFSWWSEDSSSFASAITVGFTWAVVGSKGSFIEFVFTALTNLIHTRTVRVFYSSCIHTIYKELDHKYSSMLFVAAASFEWGWFSKMADMTQFVLFFFSITFDDWIGTEEIKECRI